MREIVLYCTVLYGIGLDCIVLYCLFVCLLNIIIAMQHTEDDNTIVCPIKVSNSKKLQVQEILVHWDGINM